MDKHTTNKSKKVSKWEDEEIKEIGILMGDPNFDIYFKTLQNNTLIIIEDIKDITRQKLIESEINVTHFVNGSNELRRHFDVLRAVDINVNRKQYFLVDNDKGIGDFRNVLSSGEQVEETKNGFKKYKYTHNVYLILLPEGFAMEELFSEHKLYLRKLCK